MSAPVDFRSERRADRAAEAEQRRVDAAAADARRVERERAADERAARLREQERADRAQARADRAARREERKERRARGLTPEVVYRTGTLALVAASGLASLPAQVIHFVSVSSLLLPLPFAVEGAAWVMAAGVAYADVRRLPVWVRWLLRVLVAAFAGFAASINYGYGAALAGGAVSESEARTMGLGLAAVTLLGPVLFEIRQWVSTLAAVQGGSEDRARRRHDRARRRHHRRVVRVADRLLSAAPLGELTEQEAWTRAWEVVHGPAAGDGVWLTCRLEKRAARTAARRTPVPVPPEPEAEPEPAGTDTVPAPLVLGPFTPVSDLTARPGRNRRDLHEPVPVPPPGLVLVPGGTATGTEKTDTTAPSRFGEHLRAVRAWLAATPDLSGAEIGRRLDASDSYGRRLRRAALAEAAS